jgi:hypothetical protein
MHDRTRLNLSKELECLTIREKRLALAEIVRTTGRQWRGVEITNAEKLEAIRLDNDLAGHGTAVRAMAALAVFLGKLPATQLDQFE